MVCIHAATQREATLTRPFSCHDAPKTTFVCDRRFRHHKQVRALFPLLSHVTGLKNVGSRDPSCFLWHTKPHTGRLLHETRQTWYPSRTTPLGTVAQDAMHANVHLRGSKFLKSWMEFLEENADLRYPNLADVYVDEQNA
jgi:hypothetical protein